MVWESGYRFLEVEADGALVVNLLQNVVDNLHPPG